MQARDVPVTYTDIDSLSELSGFHPKTLSKMGLGNLQIGIAIAKFVTNLDTKKTILYGKELEVMIRDGRALLIDYGIELNRFYSDVFGSSN